MLTVLLLWVLFGRDLKTPIPVNAGPARSNIECRGRGGSARVAAQCRVGVFRSHTGTKETRFAPQRNRDASIDLTTETNPRV